MPTYYLDYELGDDANDGSDWVNAWKTITLGATAARIVPSDIVRIAKSPAPVSLGTTGIWTNLSKTVTLGAVQTLNIDLCETAWTANGSGDTTVTRIAVATDGKEGSYCMKLAFDASPQTSIMQAYYQISDTDFSSYQKISFWIRNSGAITAGTLRIVLCSDTAGATPVDYFDIPANPSIQRWVPLTLTKSGGGNLGASIQSIALYTDSAITGLASKYIYVDDFIACTTNGLNLQSLISKNSAEQGGTEGWYGIQSINGTTVLLDDEPNTKATDGRGYSGTTETVTTYKRETIKTALATSSITAVQEVMDSGTVGNNIQFQGGYNTSTSNQDGETFFDGLSGYGYGLYQDGKGYITLNYLNFYRYYNAIYYLNSSNNTISTLSNVNNNTYIGVYYKTNCRNNTIITLSNANNNNFGVSYWIDCNNNTITTLSNANNSEKGVYYEAYCSNNTITTLSNANNNADYGVFYESNCDNNIITVLSNANSNDEYGVYYYRSYNNIIRTLSTTGNVTAGIYNDFGTNYISHATIAEATKISGMVSYHNSKIYITGYASDPLDNRIYTDNGNIISQVATRHTASGMAWQLNPTNVIRNVSYPLTLSIAKIAVVADKAVTVKAWMKISNTTDVLGALVVRGGQLTGVASDVKTNASTADTNWHEVTLADFTPTEAGVIEIECWAWWVANAADESVYIDDMTITQAN